MNFCSSRRSRFFCRRSDEQPVEVVHLLRFPPSRFTLIRPTSTEHAGRRLAAREGIIARCVAPTEKTKVASSHIAMDAMASSHSLSTNGPPSPIWLSIDCAPLV